MPRPERPLNPEAGPLQAFAAELRILREQAGNPKYLQMARVSGRSRTALAEAAGGDHLPTWETTEAFVTACGGDLGVWRQKWEEVQEQIRPSSESSETGQPANGPGDFENSNVAALPVTVDSPRDKAEVLLRMWQEQRTQARQCENQRALMTVVIALASLWILSYVAFTDGPFTTLAAAALCPLGVFGALMVAKYWERFKMHMDNAQDFRRRLDKLWPDLYLESDWANNRTQHKRNFSVLYSVPLHYLWIALHISIAATGIVLTFIKFLI